MRSTTAVSLGLLGAWAVHDAEERWTMPAATRRLAAEAPAWLPLPARVRERGMSQEHVDAALAVMAAVIASGTVAGVRTRGRSWWFQALLLGFGLHGAGHVAQSAALRRYTPGVVTSPLVVLPFWWWARRRLRAEGVPSARGALAGPALLLPVVLGTHVLAAALRRWRW